VATWINMIGQEKGWRCISRLIYLHPFSCPIILIHVATSPSCRLSTGSLYHCEAVGPHRWRRHCEDVGPHRWRHHCGPSPLEAPLWALTAGSATVRMWALTAGGATVGPHCWRRHCEAVGPQRWRRHCEAVGPHHWREAPVCRVRL